MVRLQYTAARVLVMSPWFRASFVPAGVHGKSLCVTGNCFALCRYSADFGQDRDILRWILNYLDPTKAGLLTHLLNDGGPISIAYQDYDWSLNV